MFHPYGLFIGLGIVLGVLVARKTAQRLGWDNEAKAFDEMSLFVAVCALIGARLYHLATDWHAYAGADISELIAVWNGGLGIFGAILGALGGVWIWHVLVGKSRVLKLVRLCSLVSLVFPLAQAIGRLGNGWNQELYGYASSAPWAIAIEGLQNGVRVHPLFLYEALLLFGLWGAMVYQAWRKQFAERNEEYLLSLYFIGYGMIRFLLEFFRPHSAIFGPLAVAQWCSLVLIGGGIAILLRSVDQIAVRVRSIFGICVLVFLLWYGGVWMRAAMQSEELSLLAQPAQSEDARFDSLVIGEHTLSVELARTNEEIRRGLSGRNEIGSDGMLFVLGRRGVPTFWMKDMRIPLDFVWIDGSRVVYIHTDIQPEPSIADPYLKFYVPKSPVTHVLELDAGKVKELGIQIGDAVEIGVR